MTIRLKTLAGALLTNCALVIGAAAEDTTSSSQTSPSAWTDRSLSVDERASLMVEAMSLDEQMKAQGFNIISNTVTPPLEFARSGLHIRRDFYDKNPNTVLALTAAVLEGQNVMWTDPARATEAFMKWAQIQDRANAEKQIADFVKIGLPLNIITWLAASLLIPVFFPL